MYNLYSILIYHFSLRTAFISPFYLLARRKVKNGEKSPWGQCHTRPVPNGRRRSAFWLVPEKHRFSDTNQKPERQPKEDAKEVARAHMIPKYWHRIPRHFRNHGISKKLFLKIDKIDYLYPSPRSWLVNAHAVLFVSIRGVPSVGLP